MNFKINLKPRKYTIKANFMIKLNPIRKIQCISV